MVEVRFDSVEGETVAEDCQRYDAAATLSPPARTREGFLRAQGVLTRAGVFEYPDPMSGAVTREYRPVEEVFAGESMSSFALMPVTLNHPPKMLTPATVSKHQVGAIGTPDRAGLAMRADILITDQAAIDAVLSGKNKLSLGYTSRVERRSGTFVDDDGQEHRFDAVQTSIRGNHLAIITAKGSVPRAGDATQIRIDSKEQKTMKIKINGSEIEVPDEIGAELQKRVDAMATELSTTQGKLEALSSEQSKQTEVQARKDSDARELESRMALIFQAQPVLEKPVAELARMDALDIMTAVVSKERPEMKLDGKNPAFVAGAFEIVMADLAKRVDSADKLRTVANKGQKIEARTDATSKIADAFNRMNKSYENAWKPQARTDRTER